MPALTLAELLEPADWMEAAVCRSVDPDLWYPEKGGATEPAKAVCGGCPARVDCLAYALARGERHGVWGGLSERERRRLHKDAAA